MKKSLAFSLAFLLLSLLCACAYAPTMDLSGFLQQRKRLDAPLDTARLYQVSHETQAAYFIPLSDRLSLQLLCLPSGEIYECRVMQRKLGADGKPVAIDEGVHRAFLSECNSTVRAYCFISADETASILRALSVNDPAVHDQTGSSTLQTGHFSVHLISHPLETVLCVRNEWLMESETTCQPESVPLYDDTTATRRETVPHR